MIVKISASARNRQFGKAIRQIRKELDRLAASLSTLAIHDERFAAVLVSVTDDIPDCELEIFPNNENVFQVHVGCKANPSSSRFCSDVFRSISIAILSCSFQSDDEERVKAVLDRELLQLSSEHKHG